MSLNGYPLQLSSQQPLQTASRTPCPLCGRTRAFFCYDCLLPLVGDIPQLSLPVQIDIVMHGETNAQSTGTHACMVAPDCVKLWRHQDGKGHHRRQDPLKLDLPDWDPATTAILFPESKHTPVVGKHGRLIVPHGAPNDAAVEGHTQHSSQGAAQCTALSSGCPAAINNAVSCNGSCCAGSSMSSTTQQEHRSSATSTHFSYTRIVVLDGNWVKARGLLRHPKLAMLPRVQLPHDVRTSFWRRGAGTFRGAVDEGVCTIEAIYFVCRQLQPNANFDDLLWFFSYMRQLVNTSGSKLCRINDADEVMCSHHGDCVIPASV